MMDWTLDMGVIVRNDGLDIAVSKDELDTGHDSYSKE